MLHLVLFWSEGNDHSCCDYKYNLNAVGCIFPNFWRFWHQFVFLICKPTLTNTEDLMVKVREGKENILLEVQQSGPMEIHSLSDS